MRSAKHNLVRPFLFLLVFLGAFGAGVAFAGAASATSGYSQVGYKSGATNVDGGTADITSYGLPAPANGCVLYAITVTNWDNGDQVEAGTVNCSSMTLDSGDTACTSGHRYVETYSGSSYKCYQGNGYTDGTLISPTVQRVSSPTNGMKGGVSGATAAISGFPSSATIRTVAMGEDTEGSGHLCPSGPGWGAFNQF